MQLIAAHAFLTPIFTTVLVLSVNLPVFHENDMLSDSFCFCELLEMERASEPNE